MLRMWRGLLRQHHFREPENNYLFLAKIGVFTRCECLFDQ